MSLPISLLTFISPKLIVITFAALHMYYEPEVLEQLRLSNPDALTSIYYKHWEALFISAYNILKDKAAAEDIIQDIFLSLWINTVLP